MNFLIDTNIASEAMRREPSADVVAWTGRQPLETLYFSIGTIAEIDFGIARLDESFRKVRLTEWRDELVRRSRPRLLPVDLVVANTWGIVRARAVAAGRTMPLVDALLAATAEVHGLTLVTRNVSDFETWGGPVFNPWTDA
jgi:predicted nucleic acid-binding protein